MSATTGLTDDHRRVYDLLVNRHKDGLTRDQLTMRTGLDDRTARGIIEDLRTIAAINPHPDLGPSSSDSTPSTAFTRTPRTGTKPTGSSRTSSRACDPSSRRSSRNSTPPGTRSARPPPHPRTRRTCSAPRRS